MDIGLQLWTMKLPLANDFDQTLDVIAETGYRFLEVAAYDKNAHTFHGHSPQNIKAKIEQRGMKLLGAHGIFDLKDAEQVCIDFALAGMQYIVYSYLPDEQRASIDDYKKAAETFNKIGAIALAHGLQFGYHNHAFEFNQLQDILPFNVLLEQTDAAKVFFEIDLGWVIYAGEAPNTFFKKHAGRFPLWHVRDITGDGRSVAIGDGKIDYNPIFDLRAVAGFKHAIVEIGSNEPNAIVNIKKSYTYLRRLRLLE